MPEENTVRLGPLAETNFRLRIDRQPQPVIGVVPDQIVTRFERREARVDDDGGWAFDPAEDVAMIACVHRHAPTGGMGLGLVSGFRFQRHGALGSTVGHDAHNMLIAGTNERDMLACARALAEMGGGFVVVADGAVRERLALPVAGLMTSAPVAEVCRRQAAVNGAAAALGCPLHSPFGALSFLALTVIPELRITDAGLFDVESFALVGAEGAV
jgi:adenine deaminase